MPVLMPLASFRLFKEMTMETNEKIVLGILENLIPEEKRSLLTLNSDLREELGLDSFKLISLVMALQSKTNFDITKVENEDDLSKVTTALDVVTLVNQQSSPGNSTQPQQEFN